MRLCLRLCVSLVAGVGFAVAGGAGCSDSDSEEIVMCTVGQDCPSTVGSELAKPLSEWAAEWWQWALSSPDSNNPMSDVDGSACQVNQAEPDADTPPVWFLAGTTHGGEPTIRTCSMPAGRALLIPILNSAVFPCFANEDCQGRGFDDPDVCEGEPNTEAFVEQSFAEFDIGGIVEELGLVVDGKDMSDQLIKQRAASEVFEFTGPDSEEDAVLACTSGTRLAKADGYWAFLEPLPSRDEPYEILISADTNVGFTVDVRYKLTVTPAE